ncbi:transcription factor ETV7 isoform X7 [Marmota marmota marmota]|uniref:transcription factor ETV7 isoform X7 n=1 Tax=Marmota marmota marmota TaxID=9994 RepID=UPI000762360B|nr:transcription factor ETV7 isoform X7 [Marmota marmota marmota]
MLCSVDVSGPGVPGSSHPAEPHGRPPGNQGQSAGGPVRACDRTCQQERRLRQPGARPAPPARLPRGPGPPGPPPALGGGSGAGSRSFVFVSRKDSAYPSASPRLLAGPRVHAPALLARFRPRRPFSSQRPARGLGERGKEHRPVPSSASRERSRQKAGGPSPPPGMQEGTLAYSPVGPAAATHPLGTQVQARCEAQVQLLGETGICKLPGRLRLQPALWSREDVLHWLRWAEQEYSLPRTPERGFQLNGRALCILTKDDFRRRAPGSGDVLYELLQFIKTQRRALVCRPFLLGTCRQRTRPGLPQAPEGEEALPEAPSPLRLPPAVGLRVPAAPGRQNRVNMTYEKMSRALRHYYKLNIIRKEPGQKLLFRFLKTPEEKVRHKSSHLEQLESQEQGGMDFKDKMLVVPL